ncbi:hypothetical protein GCM10010429_56850 [Micromonospora olivasterospora]
MERRDPWRGSHAARAGTPVPREFERHVATRLAAEGESGTPGGCWTIDSLRSPRVIVDTAGRARGGPTARPSRTATKGALMAAISREEVAHLARLSRLAVTEEELDVFAGQLDVILRSVAQVGEVAAADIPPTSHSVPLTNVLREDVVVPGLTPQEALSGAPDAEEQRFRVPRILDEDVAS